MRIFVLVLILSAPILLAACAGPVPEKPILREVNATYTSEKGILNVSFTYGGFVMDDHFQGREVYRLDWTLYRGSEVVDAARFSLDGDLRLARLEFPWDYLARAWDNHEAQHPIWYDYMGLQGFLGFGLVDLIDGGAIHQEYAGNTTEVDVRIEHASGTRTVRIPPSSIDPNWSISFVRLAGNYSYNDSELLPYQFELWDGPLWIRTVTKTGDSLPRLPPWPQRSIPETESKSLPYPGFDQPILGINATAKQALIQLRALSARADTSIRGGCLTGAAVSPIGSSVTSPIDLLSILDEQADTFQFYVQDKNGTEWWYDVSRWENGLGQERWVVNEEWDLGPNNPLCGVASRGGRFEMSLQDFAALTAALPRKAGEKGPDMMGYSAGVGREITDPLTAPLYSASFTPSDVGPIAAGLPYVRYYPTYGFLKDFSFSPETVAAIDAWAPHASDA